MGSSAYSQRASSNATKAKKEAEPVINEKTTPKVNQQTKDTQAEINLKKKKEKELHKKPWKFTLP